MTRSQVSKLALGVLALIVILAFWKLSRRTPTLESENLGTVTKADLVQRVTVAGTVTPIRKSVIMPPYNGFVKKLYVRVGDKVGVGDPIVSLSQTLRGAGEDSFPLRAPFEGTVVQVLRTEGEFVGQSNGGVDAANALVRIDDLTQLMVEASAPEIEVVKLKVGQDAVIKASAVLGRPYKGKIQNIALAAKEQKDWDRSRVEFGVSIRITDHDEKLKPGMSVIVDVITNQLNKVLTLRHEFIQRDGEKYFVVTEKGDRKPIEVGAQNEEVFEIKQGLQEGEKVKQADFLSLFKEQ